MKLPSVMLIAAAVTAGVGLPASGQVDFNPSLAAEGTYSNNLGYTSGSASRDSDTAYRLSANLPVTRSWRTGSLQFGYTANLYRFQDSDQFDRIDQTANFGVQSNLSRKNNISFDTNFSRGQTQAAFPSPQDANVVLTQRTDRDSFRANARFDSQISPRWGWNAGAGFGSVRHESIPGSTGGGLPVQDRDYTNASAGVGRQLSKKTSMGVALRFLQTRLQNGDEEVYNAGLSVSRRVDRKSSLNFGAGAYSTTSTIPNTPDRSGASLSLGYSRDFRRVSLGTFVGHQPSPGGNLPGTSTNTNVGASIRGAVSPTWRWGFSGQFTHRDPSDPTVPEVNSRGFGGNVTWLAHAKLGLRLTATTVTQSVAGTPDTEFSGATLGIVWFPKG